MTTLDVLGDALFNLYLTMKYSMDIIRVGMVRGDQEMTIKCY